MCQSSCLSLFFSHTLQLLWLSLNKVASSSGKKWAGFCSVWLRPSICDNTNTVCLCEPLWVFTATSLCVHVFIHLFVLTSSCARVSVHACACMCVCVMKPDVQRPIESAASVHYFIFKAGELSGAAVIVFGHLCFILVVFLFLSDETLTSLYLGEEKCLSMQVCNWIKCEILGRNPLTPGFFQNKFKTQMCWFVKQSIQYPWLTSSGFSLWTKALFPFNCSSVCFD